MDGQDTTKFCGRINAWSLAEELFREPLLLLVAGGVLAHRPHCVDARALAERVDLLLGQITTEKLPDALDLGRGISLGEDTYITSTLGDGRGYVLLLCTRRTCKKAGGCKNP